MSRPTPRRPSRTSTPRPRTLAGRRPPATDAPPDVDVADLDEGDGAPPAEPPVVEMVLPAGEPRRERLSLLSSARVTRMLLAVLGALVLLLVLQTAWLFVHDIRNDDGPQQESGGSDDTIAVDPDRPVVLGQLAVQEGVEAAAVAAETMFARTHDKYDAEVDEATALMTESFAEEYRKTTDDVRREFIAAETEVQVRVVAQSVVRANQAELDALVYLNQYVSKGQGKKATTTYTPYRALLTMVHTDQGWLVDDLDTK